MGDGLTNALRCTIRLTDGTTRAAILKKMPKQSVLAEAFSALLLSSWGLRVPQPFLVQGAGDEIHFASADAVYPSLKQRFGLGSVPDGALKSALVFAASSIIAGLPQTPLALAADEAIDNRDRNLGNVLWDGQEEAWIDHELALGLAEHLGDGNKLADMVNAAGSIPNVKQSSVAAWMAMDRSMPVKAALATGTEHFGELVAKRLNALGGRIIARFPVPEDLLSEG